MSDPSKLQENATSELTKFGFGQVKNLDKQLSKCEAIKLISSAIDEWKNVTENQVNICNASAGYLNSIWLVERTDCDEDLRSSKLIIRFYGGNKSSPWEKSELLDHGFGLELETTVALAASETGIGPKVFYSTDKFRIEEFVRSRNFTFNDYSDIKLVDQFARNLARFHSMSDRSEFERFRVTKVNLFDHARSKLTCQFDRWTRICNLATEKYGYTGKPRDIIDELNLMEKLSSKVPLKYTLINWDLNTMNILVRNKLTHPNQLATVLIDYEFAHFNIRSFDIGLNASRMSLRNFVFGNKCNFSADEISHELKSFEENFLTAYYDEISKYSKTFDQNGSDSWKSFVIEALWGSCFAWIESTALRLTFLFALMSDEDQVIDINAKGLQGCFCFHQRAKERLFELAPHLAVDI